jgi:hypothetical protein
LFAATLFAPHALAGSPSKNRLNGELCTVEGVRVLRIWGSPRERGFAHGWLLGSDIIKLLDGYIADGNISGGPQQYEASLHRVGAMMKIEPRYREELRGLFEGIVAGLGDEATIPTLNRPIRYEDVVAINCIPDSTRMGCSSFAAWGVLTDKGQTLSGRNLDWHRIAALRGSQVAIAFLPARDSERGWISITWPGFIGCLTGMNADGITASMHDVPTDPPSTSSGFTPRGLILREAIENANGGPETALGKVCGVLARRITCVGNNVPISMPFVNHKNPPSAVFEYDGNISKNHGYQKVVPISKGAFDKFYQVCTNHFCKRGKPSACDRYQKILSRLRALGREGKTLDVAGAWQILRSVACRGGPLETYHSVVFEPNARRLHVAFSSSSDTAQDCKPVTLNLADLLARE